MNSIIVPNLIAIDTYILGNVAKDYNSQTQSRRKKALKFLSTITDRGLIPFFCMHHFQEILQHDNDSVAYGRLSLIKRFPQVAWVKPSSPEGLVGSIIDIQGTEISKLINDPNISIKALIAEIRQELISYSSGESFINGIEEELIILRKLNLFETHKNKTISSISHVRDSNIDNLKLSELHRSHLKRPSEVNESMELLRESLKQELKKRGDKKLENQDEAIDQFLKLVIKDGHKMYEPNQGTLYKKFINSHGLEEHEVDENWTFGELGYYAIFKGKIKVIARSFNFDLKKALKIPPNVIPSWLIWVELDKKSREEKRAAGSNIIDKYLASLAFYADILIVDKTVKEYFKQITQKHKKYSFINNHIIKLSKYENLGKQLDTLNLQYKAQTAA